MTRAKRKAPLVIRLPKDEPELADNVLLHTMTTTPRAFLLVSLAHPVARDGMAKWGVTLDGKLTRWVRDLAPEPDAPEEPRPLELSVKTNQPGVWRLFNLKTGTVWIGTRDGWVPAPGSPDYNDD